MDHIAASKHSCGLQCGTMGLNDFLKEFGDNKEHYEVLSKEG